MTKRWFVFYTKSRAEKKTMKTLEKFGFKVFLPTVKVMRQWSDRKKKVEVPLFNSYLFVYEEEHRIVEVLKVPGVAWNIRHNGKPAYLRDDEYEKINKLITSGYAIEAEGYDQLQKGDEVTIIDGPLRGFNGIVDKTGDQQFKIIIPSIGQAVKVQVDKSILQRV